MTIREFVKVHSIQSRRHTFRKSISLNWLRRCEPLRRCITKHKIRKVVSLQRHAANISIQMHFNREENVIFRCPFSHLWQPKRIAIFQHIEFLFDNSLYYLMAYFLTPPRFKVFFLISHTGYRHKKLDFYRRAQWSRALGRWLMLLQRRQFVEEISFIIIHNDINMHARGSSTRGHSYSRTERQPLSASQFNLRFFPHCSPST